MSYATEIAPIGNNEARLAELLRLSMRPGGERLLFEALWDPYPPLRHRAAEELAETMSDEVAELAAQVATGTALTSELPAELSVDVRRAAALALRTDSLPQQAQALLVQAAGDEDEVVRYHALLALHRNASEPVLREVTERGLADSDAGVTVVAAQIAAEHRWLDLAPELRAAFGRLEGTDQFQLAVALSEVLELPLQGDGGLRGQPRPLYADEAMVDVLVAGLRDEKTLAAACKALARLRAKRAAVPLRKVMSSFFAHPINRVEAAAALVALGDAEGTRYLEKMLEGRRKDTRGYAIELVARLGLQQYRDRIEALAMSSDYHADTAVLALRNFGDARAFELLREIAQKHPDPDIRELASETSAADGTVD